jgi:hypothetical protein
MVRDDLPEPETPVTTTSLFRGIFTVTFLRLCTLAPLMRIESFSSLVPSLFFSILRFVVEMAIIEPTKISRRNEY